MTGRRTGGVRRTRRADGVRLAFEGGPTLDVRVRGVPGIVGPKAELGWPLWRGLPTGWFNRSDPFRAFLEEVRAFGELAGEPDAEAYEVVRGAARWAAARCEPEARAAALRFLPHMRWFAYRAMVADRTGRVRQLAEVCPGALILARALEEHEVEGDDGPAAAALLADAVEGRPLNALIERALEAWLGYVRWRATEDDLWSRPWQRALAEPGVARAQRLLVRRAGPQVPTTLLWLPPPPGDWRADDIPRAVVANRRWFEATRAVGGLFAAELGLEAPALAGLGGFVSRHAIEIAAEARALQVPVPTYVRRLVTRVAGGWRPARGTGLRPVADALLAEGEIERRLAEVREICHAFAVGGIADPGRPAAAVAAATRLPASPIAAPAPAAPVATVGELVELGIRMRNCLPTLVPHALAGQMAFYRLPDAGRGLVVQLQRMGEDWELSEIRGYANRRPTRRQLRRVLDWWREARPEVAAPELSDLVKAWREEAGS